jgi:putative chitinase
MTEQQLAKLVGGDRAHQWIEGVNAMLDAAQASTILRAAHMLAQVLHETAGLRVTTENLNYSAERLQAVWPSRFTPELAARLANQPALIANHVYGGRLGNTQPGDGWRFRGRGCIQLTGRHNYGQYEGATGAPVTLDPEPVAFTPHAALAAAWYWVSRGINSRADADDLEAVTRAVNGGLNGLADRRKWLDAAKTALRPSADQPERLGEYEVVVLHGLTPALVLRALDAVLDGDGSAVMGRAVASVTGGRKIDLRYV